MTSPDFSSATFTIYRFNDSSLDMMAFVCSLQRLIQHLDCFSYVRGELFHDGQCSRLVLFCLASNLGNGLGALILLAPLRLGGYCHYRSAAPVGVRQAWAQAQAQVQVRGLGAEAALSNEPTLISVSSQYRLGSPERIYPRLLKYRQFVKKLYRAPELLLTANKPSFWYVTCVNLPAQWR